MMTRAQILERIRAILAQNFEIQPDAVREEVSFHAQLGLDSLDVVDLAFLIQREFDLEAELESFRGLHTVGLVVDFVMERANTADAGGQGE